MSKYHPESWRANASQNGLGLPHIVDWSGRRRSSGNASTAHRARNADTRRKPSAAIAIRTSALPMNIEDCGLRTADSDCGFRLRIRIGDWEVRIPEESSI